MLKNKIEIIPLLNKLYGSKAEDIYIKIEQCIANYTEVEDKAWVSEKDSILITYGDSIISHEISGISALHDFMKKYIQKTLSSIHILPFYPYSSDDGFSVIDYTKVSEDVGDWDEIKGISNQYDLMFDAVINHISIKSDWFLGYLNGEEKYRHYFIECDPTLDYTRVTRPRSLPLLTEFETKMGKRHIWTTFSGDQVDLNYNEPELLLEILNVLCVYISKGARYIRLDAIGFLWKKLGTTCMHLKETHEVVKLIRLVSENISKGIIFITETNTPHKENISYFGNGHDEAKMVYQFPLPPLTLHAFLKGDAYILLKWLDKIHNVSDETTYFNFLASHDGIGLRPVEGILSTEEVDFLVEEVLNRGGKISYRDNGDKSKSPYEMNINYMEAICGKIQDKQLYIAKFMASQAILLSVIGVPGIYIHSLIGSTNDIKGMKESGINRRINREKLEKTQLFDELDHTDSIRRQVLEAYKHLLNIRKSHSAFSPVSGQQVIFVDKRLFTIRRENAKETIDVMINLTQESYVAKGCRGTNLVTGKVLDDLYEVQAYEVVWLKR